MRPVAVSLSRALTGAILAALVLRTAVEIRRITEEVPIDSGAYLLIGLESVVAFFAIFAVSVWLYSRPAYRLLGSVEAEPDELLLLAGPLPATRPALAQLAGSVESIHPNAFFVLGVSTRGVSLWVGTETSRPAVHVPSEAIRNIALGRVVDNWVEIGFLEIYVLDGEGRPVTLPCVIHTERLGAFWSLTRRELAGLELALAEFWPHRDEADTPPR